MMIYYFICRYESIRQAMWFSPQDIKQIPEQPGVYQYFSEREQLLYVGKAKNLKKRVSSYFQKQDHSERIHQMIQQIDKIFIQVVNTENDALILENHLIRAHKPKYNIIFRDDKSYPYIKISEHGHPRLGLHRGRSSKGIFFGPYPNSFAARESIEVLQKIFHLRSCEDGDFASRKKPCLLYQIKRCSGPCVDELISQENYAKDVESAKLFLKGDYPLIFKNLERKMQDLAADLEFEQAAYVRNQIMQLNELFKQQNMDIKKNWDVDIIEFAYTAPYIAIAVGIVRAGRHLGHKIHIEKLALNVGLGQSEEIKTSVTEEADLQEVLFEYLSQTYAKDYDPQNIQNDKKQKRYILLPVDLKVWQTQQSFMPAFKYLSHRYTHAKDWLANTKNNAELSLARHLNSQKQVEQQLYALKELLTLTTLNPRIECFDISHTSGDFTKASCVVFENKQFNHQAFRHFNLQLQQKGDDYEAMYQALKKRYQNHQAEQLPDVLLIDGGPGQLSVAIKALSDLGLPHGCVYSIAKGDARKVGLETILFADSREPVTPGLHNLGLLLLAKIRDQAHDYAVNKMRLKRDKKIKSSILDEIEGIGPVKRKRLLTRFGGLDGLIKASVEELMQVEGISTLR